MGFKIQKKEPSAPLRMPQVRGVSKTRPPKSVKPALATLANSPPEGDNWLHEIKYDGYRIISHIKDKKISLLTRHGKDWTARFPSIAAALVRLPVSEAWLDGEVVFIRSDGRSSFGGLQKALSEGIDAGLRYIIFDIIFMDGMNLAKTPLIERKRLVKRLFAGKKPVRSLNSAIT